MGTLELRDEFGGLLPMAGVTVVAGRGSPWSPCPNDPPCAHAAMFHDIEDYDDPSPTCCAKRCGCGRRETLQRQNGRAPDGETSPGG